MNDKNLPRTASPLAKVLILSGTVTAGTLNAVLLERNSRSMRHAAGQPELFGTTIVSCVIGYYFTKWITEGPGYARGAVLGGIAGLLIGAMNGTFVFPIIGTIIGAGVGLVLGLICGLIVTVVLRTFEKPAGHPLEPAVGSGTTPKPETVPVPAVSLKLRSAAVLLAVVFSPLPWLAFTASKLNIDFNHPEIPWELALTPFVAAAAAWLLAPRIAAAPSWKESLTPGATCCMLSGAANGLLLINPVYALLTAFLGLLSGLAYGPLLRAFSLLAPREVRAAFAALLLLAGCSAGGAYAYVAHVSAGWKEANQRHYSPRVWQLRAEELNREADRYFQKKDYKKARETWEKALSEDPENPTAKVSLSMVKQIEAVGNR